MSVDYTTMTDEEVAMSLPLEVIEQEVETMAREMSIPDGSKRNAYTKACYIVSKLQSAIGKVRRHTFPGLYEEYLSNVESNLRFLRAALPRLREKYRK